MTYQSFIGLEVHIHLLTKTKVFCRCRSAFGDEPNANVCPVCLGYPGVLPALNIEAMRMGCMVARSLNCTIPERTWFERKQYFYPDMTKNYQISQFASPLGQQGHMELEGRGPGGGRIKKKVRIKECHLEEDAGKMIHTGAVSLLDYNRAGVSLLEIVTEPDMESGEEAELFIQELRRMVRYLGVCDGNMEEGSLRADANVSINFPGQGLGRKVEIKNLNSSRFVRLGLDYEIKRQGELLDSGRTVTQETRLWNENRDETMPMRHKENAQDYRYFPEPDLPVFCPGEDFRNSVEASLVELPRKRMKRMMGDYGLSEEQAELICDEKEGADYFEAAVSEAKRLSPDGENRDEIPLRIANWFLSDIKHILNREGIAVRGIASFKLSPARLASLVTMLCTGRITGKIAKQCLDSVIAEDRDPEEIVKANDWEQLTDPERISATVEAVFAAETATVTELRGIMTAARGGDIEAGVTGKAGSGVKQADGVKYTDSVKQVDGSKEKRRRTLTAYLVGKVIAATGGRADPKLAGQHVEKLLKA